MKPRSIGSVLLAALAGCSGGSSGDDGPPAVNYVLPRWSNQQRVPTASHLRAVRFNGANQGFVAGESTSLFRTDDGGLTWTQEEHTPFVRGGDIAGLDFLGTEIQAVGAANDNSLGRIWTSTDALSWSTPDADGAGAKFVAVDVTADVTGGPPNITWALRENWDIRLSDSSGGVGNNTAIPDPAGGLKATSIDMLFGGAGYVVGEGGKIFETSSHGEPFPDPNNPMVNLPGWTERTGAGANTLRDVQIAEAGIAFACGDNGTLVWTENGGDFAAIPGGPATRFRGLFFIHAFQTSSLGWVVGDGGAVWRVSGTYNAMTTTWTWTWAQVVSAPADDLYDVHFGTVTTGYAVGDNGRVIKLTDNGTVTTAQNLTKGSLDAVNAVSFEPGGVVGVAVGDAGKVYKTLDGGATWTETDLGNQTWTGVSVPAGNGTVAYICGLGGEIRRNSDLQGGNTWTAAPGNVAINGKNFRAILFPSSADVGVAVGDGNTIVWTTTGSSLMTWAAATGVPASDYKALSTDFHGGGTTLSAAGSNGVVARANVGSPDSWSLMPGLPVGFAGGTGQAIATPTPQILFLALDDGAAVLHRRLLSLGFWQGTSTPSPVPPIATGLAWVGTSMGWWVSDGIYTTEQAADPGQPTDWKRSPVHTKSTFRGIWMNQVGSVGYVVGTNGAILKTYTGGK